MLTTPKQIYHSHFISAKAHFHGYRPDMRQIAIQMAEYILQNGLITSHEVIRCHDVDSYEYRFSFYCLKKQLGLP